MASVKTLNPKAEVLGRGAALFMAINAGAGVALGHAKLQPSC